MAPRRPRPRQPSVRATPKGRPPLRVLAPLLIVLAGAAAYANSLHGPFIFDDHRSILDNTTIRQLWPLTTVLRPPLQTPVTGRPLPNVSFAINYAIGALRPESYHLVNIAIHVLAALALFGVLRRTPWWPPGHEDQAAGLALFCTLAWVVHPLNTEAVDYLTQRTESMAGLFFLLTLYAAIRAWNDETRWRWSAIAVLACWLGMATKESMATVPLIVLLWDRAFKCPSFRAAFAERGRLYLGLASGWILLGLLSLDTPFFSATGFETSVSRWVYLLNQPPLIARYLRLVMWPAGLVLDYGMARPLTLGAVWPSALLVLALLAATAVALVRAPRLGFWGAWFFITLAPASSVLPIPSEVGAERRMYLPLVAAIVVITMAALWAFDRIVALRARQGAQEKTPGSAAVRPVAWTIGVLLLVGLTTATIWRNEEYSSGLSIWQTVVARYPQPRAHENLAVQLRDAGRRDEMLEHLRIAAPEIPEARHALGSALIGGGDVRGGIAELREFVRANPNDREIIAGREELASALLGVGDRDGAIAELRAVVAAAPQYARGHLNLGALLLASNDAAGAAAQYQACLKLQPDNVVAMAQLGRILAGSGHRPEAIAMLTRASALQPGDVEVRRVLIELLLDQQKFADVETEAHAFLALRPGDGDVHNLLGVALASEQRLDAAVEEFEAAVRLDPGSREFRNNLDRALSLQKRGRE